MESVSPLINFALNVSIGSLASTWEESVREFENRFAVSLVVMFVVMVVVVVLVVTTPIVSKGEQLLKKIVDAISVLRYPAVEPEPADLVMLSWLEIDFGSELHLDGAHGLLTSLVSASEDVPLVFETYGQGGQLRFRVGTTAPERLAGLVEAFLPNASIWPVKRSLPQPVYGQAWELAVTHQLAWKAIERWEVGGSEVAIFEPQVPPSDRSTAPDRRWGPKALSSIASDVMLHHYPWGPWSACEDIDLQPLLSDPQGVSQRLLAALAAVNPTGFVVSQVVVGERRFPEPSVHRSLKGVELSARTNVRLLVADRNSESLGVNWLAGLRSIQPALLRFDLHPTLWHLGAGTVATSPSIDLEVSELLNLVAWPLGAVNYPGVDRQRSKRMPAPTGGYRDRMVGFSAHPSQSGQAVGLSAQDGLRHLHVLGPSGVGKSTALLHLASQDVASGRGVVVLDPKGDLVDDLLARLPAEADQRLVVIDPARSDYFVGVNPLHTRPARYEFAVNGLVHIFESLYRNSWGPRTQDVLHSSLLSLAGSQYATICAIPRLLTDPQLRQEILGGRPAGPLDAFWSRYNAMSDSQRDAVIAPLMNKLSPFMLTSPLRATFGQVEPAFQIRQVFSERKVLLVALRKGQIGADAANLLGSMVIAQVWQAAQERGDMPADRRHPVFVYADEFQDYLRLRTSFEDVLAQARGLGLGLVLAHQHLGQLQPDMKAAVLANAQSRISFRLSSDDARELARLEAGALEAEDYRKLPAYHAYASLLINGNRYAPASIETFPPSQPIVDPATRAVAAAERWGRELAEVDESLYGVTVDEEVLDVPFGRRTKPEA